jgi:DNA-binding beta-propeller fold protein YncE
MHGNKRFRFAVAAALTAAVVGPAQAKDLYYFFGYESIQVIDGQKDAVVATIPVRGWIRESAVSSDKSALYVTTSRHVVQKVSLSETRSSPAWT